MEQQGEGVDPLCDNTSCGWLSQRVLFGSSPGTLGMPSTTEDEESISSSTTPPLPITGSVMHQAILHHHHVTNNLRRLSLAQLARSVGNLDVQLRRTLDNQYPVACRDVVCDFGGKDTV